jgi:NADPH:quinone reductase-like Zn-dependent oxidoreductase
MPTPQLDFLVDRRDLRRCTVERGPDPETLPLAPDQVLLRVAAFGLTANNVTYAVFGDVMGYWRFFPSHDEWGRVPVWGFADVVRSRHDGVPAGERVWGYFPMSTHLVIDADKVSARSLVDAAPHRRELPPVYNQYVRVAADPGYDRQREAQEMLFRPLFTTAFLLDDLLAERSLFGAQTVLIASASSKTALGLAFLLKRHRRGRVVGLTSAANAAFVERTGCYDQVVSYADIPALPAGDPVVVVDMAGSGDVLRAVHGHFADRLKYSCLVGATHWEAPRNAEALPGPTPEFFFAPDRVVARMKDWGPDGFQARVDESRKPFLAAAEGWLRIVARSGPAAVEQAYRDTLEGRTGPDQGLILTL